MDAYGRFSGHILWPKLIESNSRSAITLTAVIITTILLALAAIVSAAGDKKDPKEKEPAVQLGPRPFYLVADMDPSRLKTELEQCSAGPFEKTDFSIGHRGAALQFPEHTRESYVAAARMGAGIIECDVTFTRDRELICRHSQCDLHTTTDVVAREDLREKCTTPPAFSRSGKLLNPADIKCCASDFTLAEFKSLCGKMDAADRKATTIEQYLDATAGWRTDLYATCGTVLSHVESIELFKDLGVKMTPELKSPSVNMPYEGDYTQQDYAQQMIDEYKAAGVKPQDVYVQSFNLDDVRYWIDKEPDFGRQAVFLDGRFRSSRFDHTAPGTWSPGMAQLVAEGVNIIAPPMWMLLALDGNKKIVPSVYAKGAREAGLEIITWTLERSGLLKSGGGFYYRTTAPAINNDGDAYITLDVLAQEVGIRGIFSDWPATVTYYANCKGLK